MTNCPKCGAGWVAEATECPRCGIIYARYEAAQAKKREDEAEAAQRALLAAKQEAEERRAKAESQQKERPKRRGLVFCPVCKKQVSGNAESCPNCGEPIRDNPNLVSAEVSLGFKIGMFIVLCFAGWLAYWLWWGAYGSPSAKYEAESPSSAGYGAEQSNIIVIDKNTVGCRSIEDFRKLADIAASKDYEAFGKAAVNYTAAGRCVIFAPGAQVYREDSSLRHGAVKVRAAGETESWWINMR